MLTGRTLKKDWNCLKSIILIFGFKIFKTVVFNDGFTIYKIKRRNIMSRLKKLAKMRPKKKELVLTYKFQFNVYNDNEDDAKQDIKRFKQWMKEQFVHWPESMLQYFLYAYNLHQNHDDRKYLLEGHIDKVLKDESVTIDERDHFDQIIVNLEEESKQRQNEMENQLFNDNDETFDLREPEEPEAPKKIKHK